MASNRKGIWCFIAILACLFVHWVRQNVPQTKPIATVTPIRSHPKVEQHSITNTTNSVSVVDAKNDWDWTNQVPPGERAGAVEQVRKLRRIVSAANVPIVFYGKIIDQDSQAVGGVRVETVVTRWDVLGLAQRRSQQITNAVFSDSKGTFTVRGINGESLALFFQKEGYELAPGNLGGFGYGPAVSIHHNPDPANPVVYRMWKRKGGAELVSQGFEKKVRADWTPISLDLVSGQFVIGADKLPGPTVRVWRQPLKFDYQTSPPDAWRYELVWPGGKLKATEDFFCYLAPEAGYEDKLESTIRKGDANYRFRDKRDFYFINREGRYGRGVLEVWADREGEAAEVTLWVSWNPDGSRNLEPKSH